MATALQIVGLVVLVAGLFVWFGPGPALVVGGLLGIVSGTALELDRRRA